MREYVSFRINDHQKVDGVQEYSVEITIPGRYNHIFVGRSQTELISQIITSMGDIMTTLEIPMTTPPPQEPELIEPQIQTFRTADGKRIPISGFAATAHARFAGEVYRDGRRLTDEETKPR